MNVYYQSLLEEINSRIEAGNFREAAQRINAELEVPYVPVDVLQQLQAWKRICDAETALPSSPDTAKLDRWVQGTPVQQEMAVSLLCGLNLRQYHSQVQALLLSGLLDEFKGQLIEALMLQKVDEPYEIVKHGLEIRFVPGTILPADQDKTLLAARNLFDKWLLHEDPSLCEFCNRLLDQEILDQRPFDFTELDPVPLAGRIVYLVYEAMGNPDGWLNFLNGHDVPGVETAILSIERQGENQ